MTGRKPSPDRAALRLLDPDGAFLDRLRQDRAMLEALLGRLRSNGDGTEALLATLATLAHRLAGAAGTFGYDAVGDAAMELEDWLEEADAAEAGFAGEAVERAGRLAGLLDDATGEG